MQVSRARAASGDGYRLRDASRTTLSTTEAGFILADSSYAPLWFNREALEIFTYPGLPDDAATQKLLLTARIAELISTVQTGRADNAGFVTRFSSGRRQYICRIFPLGSPENGSPLNYLALLLERENSRITTQFRLSHEFRFTQREHEATLLLLQGLSSKEIASRMRISPNTVKAFLRTIMAKMGVSSRAGILAKTLAISLAAGADEGIEGITATSVPQLRA